MNVARESGFVVITNKFATFAFTCKPCLRKGYGDDQVLKVLHFLVKRLYNYPFLIVTKTPLLLVSFCSVFSETDNTSG